MNPIRSNARAENRPIKILLVGHGTLGVAMLEALLMLPSCDIVGVFQWSKRKGAERDYDADEKRFTRLIQQHHLLAIRCPGVNAYEFIAQQEALKPDVILIGSWGEILKKHVLAIPHVLFINCHPSLLPAHRGAIPYCSTIRHNETHTGVTFHMVDKGIDTGAILLQESLPIEFGDTGGDIKDKCAAKAKTMVASLLEALQSPEGMTPLVQDESAKSYYPALKLEDGVIYWDEDPLTIYNQVRGLQPWLDCYTFLEGKVFFAFSKLEYVHLPEPFPLEQYPPIPGTVMRYENGTIWLSTIYTDILLGIRQFKIYVLWFFLPKWISRWLGYFLFHTGFKVTPYQASQQVAAADEAPPPESPEQGAS